MQTERTYARSVLVSIAIVLCSAAAAPALSLTGKAIIVDRSGQPLKHSGNAVIYLASPPKSDHGMVTMDLRNKEFIPRLLPVISGQKVRFRNSDVFQHNVFSPHAQEPFDLGRYRPGESREIEFNIIGPHPIYCDIHQNMIADIFVVPNRYFALTDAQGRFRIDDVPPGTYRLEGWHILGGTVSQTVRVAQDTVSITLNMRSTKLLKEMNWHKKRDARAYRPEFEYGDY